MTPGRSGLTLAGRHDWLRHIAAKKSELDLASFAAAFCIFAGLQLKTAAARTNEPFTDNEWEKLRFCCKIGFVLNAALGVQQDVPLICTLGCH